MLTHVEATEVRKLSVGRRMSAFMSFLHTLATNSRIGDIPDAVDVYASWSLNSDIVRRQLAGNVYVMLLSSGLIKVTTPDDDLRPDAEVQGQQKAVVDAIMNHASGQQFERLVQPAKASWAAIDDNVKRRFIQAARSADHSFMADGETGTRCWVDDYLIPALEAEGLAIVEAAKKDA